MSIKPIDLQTLFMQMGHVHRQQAAEKDTAATGEAYRRVEAEKKESREAKTVHGKEDDEVTSTQVKSSTEKEEAPTYQGGGHDKARPEQDEEAEAPGREVVRDPGLGKNIDISG